MSNKILAKYGLPEKVIFCKRCVMSNQRPVSYPEFMHTLDRKTPTLHIADDGICDACRYAEKKEKVNWGQRREALIKLLNKYRRKDGYYDCIVPGSGGKDSVFAAHILKYKYDMHPLTVTWPPILYTDYGWNNFCNWLNIGGFDNISFKPNGKVHRLLTKLAIKNLLHPFQTFIIGQKNLPVKIAIKYKIPLIFYGESEAEYGTSIAETHTSLRRKSYYTMKNLSKVYLGGVSISALQKKYNLSLLDVMFYLPPYQKEIEEARIKVHYLGYYIKWTPQENYYYAVRHTGFMPRPFRTQGTYSKYNSIDDKIDDLHYYTTYIKFGLGRASYDASQEIRNRHLTREEGVALVKRFDGEFPDRYFKEVMDYIGIDPDKFIKLCDKFRSPHLWVKSKGTWKLRNPIWLE